MHETTANLSPIIGAMRQSVIHARVWLLLALVISSPALASDGRFEVANATARHSDEGWLVDARVDLQLSGAAIDALQNGVTLSFEFQYEVTEYRRFWTNKELATARQDMELQYLSLSQRYLVRWLDTGEQASYATLFSALRYMGQVRSYRLPIDLPPVGDNEYLFAMRAVLTRETLPGPLQMLTFWRGDFSLESNWYQWTPN